PTAVVSAKVGSDTITLIAGHVVEYVSQVAYQREPLDVQLWIGRIGGASADVCYEIHADHALAVRAESTMVFVDAATGRPRRISAEERSAWTPYVEAPIAFKRDLRSAAKSQ
ncbi:MAG: thioesterase family protein, partial [Terrimesophilobacter sp.]